jgi:hypothetical protein
MLKKNIPYSQFSKISIKLVEINRKHDSWLVNTRVLAKVPANADFPKAAW